MGLWVNHKGGGLPQRRKTMKKITNQVKALGLRLWRDESGQGTAEYVLILVGVLGVAFLFKNKIKEVMETKLGQVGQAIGSFTGAGGG